MPETNQQSEDGRKYAQRLLDVLNHHTLDEECRACAQAKKEATEYLAKTKGE